jgi:hypothetical protein
LPVEVDPEEEDQLHVEVCGSEPCAALEFTGEPLSAA